jgi:hypothetical protein
VDLAKLDDNTYHMVATLRTAQPPSPAAEQIIDELRQDDAFLLHPVEGRIFAWLRKFKPSTLPELNFEKFTHFDECPSRTSMCLPQQSLNQSTTSSDFLKILTMLTKTTRNTRPF